MKVDHAQAEHRPLGDSVRRNTGFGLAVQLTTSAFTAALTLFLVRRLDPSGYGVFALALSLGGLLLVPSDFGISHSAARFIAEHRGDNSAIAAVLGDALKLKLVVSGVLTSALFGLAGPIASAYGSGDLTWPIRGIALAVFFQSFFLLFGAVFIAQGKVSRSLGTVLAESAVETGASIALVLLGGGAAGAAFGRAIGYTAGAALGLAVCVRYLGREVVSPRLPDRERTRQIGSYAGALAIVDGAFTLFAQLDSLLVGGFLGTAAVGIFNAPSRLVVLTQYPGLALAGAAAPRLARSRGHEPDVESFVSALRVLIVFQAALLAPVLVWAGPIVSLLLGSRYSASAHVLQVLAPFVFLAGIAPLVSLGVNYLGDARRRLPIAIGTVIISAAADVVLIPPFGLTGAAIGADLGFLLYVPAHFWICRRLINMPLAPIGLALARSLLGAAGMSAVLLAVGTGRLSALQWAVGAVGGSAAFLVMLVLTGELRRDAVDVLRRRT